MIRRSDKCTNIKHIENKTNNRMWKMFLIIATQNGLLVKLLNLRHNVKPYSKNYGFSKHRSLFARHYPHIPLHTRVSLARNCTSSAAIPGHRYLRRWHLPSVERPRPTRTTRSTRTTRRRLQRKIAARIATVWTHGFRWKQKQAVTLLQIGET